MSQNLLWNNFVPVRQIPLNFSLNSFPISRNFKFSFFLFLNFINFILFLLNSFFHFSSNFWLYKKFKFFSYFTIISPKFRPSFSQALKFSSYFSQTSLKISLILFSSIFLEISSRFSNF